MIAITFFRWCSFVSIDTICASVLLLEIHIPPITILIVSFIIILVIQSQLFF